MSELNDDDPTGDGNSQVHEEVETEQGYVMQLTKNEALFLDTHATLSQAVSPYLPMKASTPVPSPVVSQFLPPLVQKLVQ